MRNIEIQRRNIEFYSAGVVLTAEVVRGMGRFFVDLLPVLDQNVGDFAGGYAANWTINSIMELTPSLNKISEKKRTLISVGLSLATVSAVELFPIFGTPDIADIPAGFLGVLASYGVRRLAQRWVGEQVK